ncbi:MAG: HAMP domain-containing histidine kinase [Novosphingobium sp.]|nr:HAMP domain-containing histidine kinase [Novosphingobium sp.]
MAANGSVLARAVSDEEDRLLAADEPLAALQLRCGGTLPGKIAVPAILEVVRKARRYGLRLARSVSAQDGAHAITAWIEAAPRHDGAKGCDIAVRNWRSEPLPPVGPDEDEHRHRAIDRELAELTARLDADQNVLTIDAEARDLGELARAMKAGRGRPWTDFMTIEGSGHQQPLHWRLLDGACVTVPGSHRKWRVTLDPMVLPGGDPIGFELLLTADMPLADDHAKNSGQADVSGDVAPSPLGPGIVGRDIAPVLRQPIARIVANAETIRTRLAGPLHDQYADYAADIARSGQHLLGLLEDLADLEVVESSHFSTAADRIDLAEVSRQAAGILGMKARDRGIAIDAPKSGESLPAIAEFRRVLQVLLNLLGNAVNYAPEHSQVWIRLEGDGGRARIVVADQGPGMSVDEQARVFEKFERLGRSGDGGSGLGLYISRRLARAMGGDLIVESAPGQGARFTLDLPADVDGDAADDLHDPVAGFSMGAFQKRLPRIPGSRISDEGSDLAKGEPKQD